MINIPAIVYKKLEADAKIYPVNSNRASCIGHPCLRFLCYNRTFWEQQQKPDLGLQIIFHEGNIHENNFMILLQQAGVKVVEQQISYKDDKTDITGHIDCIVIDEEGVRLPLEFKTCSPYIYDQLRNYKEDEYLKAMNELSTNYPWMKKYPAQVMLYLYFKEVGTGLVIFKNKQSGQLKQFIVKLDLDYIDALFKKADKVNIITKVIIDAKTQGADIEPLLPIRIDDKTECERCDYNHLCLPGFNFGAPLKIEEDPVFEKKIDEFNKLAEAVKRHNDLNEQIKKQCKGRENVICGKYHITGKEDKKGSWRKKIEFIDDADKKALLEGGKNDTTVKV